jgi:hypothetical protein
LRFPQDKNDLRRFANLFDPSAYRSAERLELSQTEQDDRGPGAAGREEIDQWIADDDEGPLPAVSPLLLDDLNNVWIILGHNDVPSRIH